MWLAFLKSSLNELFPFLFLNFYNVTEFKYIVGTFTKEVFNNNILN